MVMVMIILTLKFGLGVYPVQHPMAQMRQVRPSKTKWFAWEHTASCGRITRTQVFWVPTQYFIHHPVADSVWHRKAWYRSYFWCITQWFCQRNMFHFHHGDHEGKVSLVDVATKSLCPWYPRSLIPNISKTVPLQAPPLKWTLGQGQ